MYALRAVLEFAGVFGWVNTSWLPSLPRVVLVVKTKRRFGECTQRDQPHVRQKKGTHNLKGIYLIITISIHCLIIWPAPWVFLYFPFRYIPVDLG